MAANRYYAEYTTSNGQPANGYVEFPSKRAAIAQARLYRGALIQGAGGKATAGRCDDSGMSHDLLWQWYEHFEGGFRTA